MGVPINGFEGGQMPLYEGYQKEVLKTSFKKIQTLILILKILLTNI